MMAAALLCKTQEQSLLTRCVAFLRDVGLVVTIEAGATGFVEGGAD